MKKYFKYILLLLFLPFIGLYFVKNASAISDYTFTIDQTTTTSTLICSNDTSDNKPLCSDYQYLKIDVNSFSQGELALQARFQSPATFFAFSSVNTSFSSVVYSLNSLYKIRVGGSSNLPSSYTIKLTFSENPFSDCPEPEPCPVCSDSSAFIQIIIDAFWKYHIAFAGIVVPLIAIFLVYRLLKGRLK